MFRTLLARLTSRRPPGQLELSLDRAGGMLARLVGLGLRGVTEVSLTTNRSVYVSWRGQVLRVHEAFVDAPDEVLQAIVAFVHGRGATRSVARKAILEYPVPRGATRVQRSERVHPDDRPLCDRLTQEHARLNAERFGGVLRSITVRISRRMRTRLGHYALASSHGTAEIVISRRHLRRDGWEEAVGTLLHEMVHQWQEESGHPVDHRATFRRKAREVGAVARARRPIRA